MYSDLPSKARKMKFEEMVTNSIDLSHNDVRCGFEMLLEI